MPDLTPIDPPPAEQVPAPAPPATIHLGDAVRLRQPLRYLKTADPMPMLRPPDLVDPAEVGEVTAIKAGNQLAVRFRRGIFLFERSQLRLVS